MPYAFLNRGLCLLLLLLARPACGQTLDLQRNTFRFTPQDTTILDPVWQAAAPAAVVFVGELDHGDGSSHELKVRLLQQLHRVHPVAVAFEADFFALNHRRTSRSLVERLQSLYPVWTDCAQFGQVMRYLVTHRLEVYGTDPQLLSPYSQQHLRPYLDSLLPAHPQKTFFLQELQRLQQTQYATRTPREQQAQFLAATRAFQTQAQSGSFEAQLLRTIEAFAQHMWQGLAPQSKIYYRDQAMGANLLWLKRTWLPTTQVVFFGANAHIGNRQTLPATAAITTAKAAFDAAEAYTSFSIGLLAYTGVAKRPTLAQSYPLPPYTSTGLERRLVDLQLDFALVKLQAPGLRGQRFYARGFEHRSKQKAEWSSIYDCFLFTKLVQPCTAAQ